MAAIIRCLFSLDPDLMTDDEFAIAWGQAKYFTALAYQIKWN
jgi:hypothetical protein